ncbi:MAG: peptidoglycan DD-metalloendopeptidase family protein [Alphaproteobacteria bacterium]
MRLVGAGGVWYRLKRLRPVRHSYRISLLSAVLAVSFAEQGLAEDLVTQDLAAQNIEITGQALSETEDALVAGRRAKAELDTQVSEIKREVHRVRRELVDSAAAAQDLEANISVLENHLTALEIERGDKQLTLTRRREELTRTLAALQRISRTPADLLIFSPASIQEISHARLLLGAVAGQLDARSDLLGDQLRGLVQIGEAIFAQRRLIDKEAERLESQRSHLGLLLARKIQIYNRTEVQQIEAEATLARLADEASTLQELLDQLANEDTQRWNLERHAGAALITTEPAESATNIRPLVEIMPPGEGGSGMVVSLDAEQPAGDENSQGGDHDEQIVALVPVRSPASAARGAFSTPARGQLVSRFDETTALGLTTKGIVIETRATAQIVAPYDGRVAFAGRFREYGLLLIIDHGEGYHTLLAGMGRIDVLLDQRVLVGEPVGVMESIAEAKPRLYVELRRDGHPINPLPWLAAETIKVSG